MTLKNNKKPSLPGDPYDTPIWCIEECVEHVVRRLLGEPSSILEPGAGSGNVIQVVNRGFPSATIDAFDIIKRARWRGCTNAVKGWDFLKHGDAEKDAARWMERYARRNRYNPIQSYGLALGNPPYTLAQEFIERTRLMAEWTIFILRLGFLASGKRAEWWEQYKPHFVFPLPDRPKFTGGQGDSADYGWFVWGPGKVKHTKILWMPLVPKARRIPKRARKTA